MDFFDSTHSTLGSLATIASLAQVVPGIIHVNTSDSPKCHSKEHRLRWPIHPNIASQDTVSDGQLTQMILCLAQVINGHFRPGNATPKTKPRRAWEVLHRVAAMASMLLAILAMFTGLTYATERGFWST
jgi:hypothetical protein